MGRRKYRKSEEVCGCGGYAFPHRLGGGLCYESPDRDADPLEDPFGDYRKQMECEWAADRRADINWLEGFK